MALIKSPLASYGLAGITTFSPGTEVNSGCMVWLCWAPPRNPAPIMERITIGVRALPPNM